MAKQRYSDEPKEKDKKTFAQYLSEDEELVVVTGFGKAYLRSLLVIRIFWPGFILIAMGVGLAYWQDYNLGYGILVGFILAVVTAVLLTIRSFHANRYLLTTRRVIVKKGIVAVKLISSLYDKITHLEVDQSFIDKVLMHHGNIIVHTAGTEKDEIVLKFIDYPVEFKNLIERLINRQRERVGIRTGHIQEIEGELIE